MDKTTKDIPQLWVDKFKPQRINQLIGNNSAINSLRNWLETWHDVHIKKSIPPKMGKDNFSAKAALISGPPG